MDDGVLSQLRMLSEEVPVGSTSGFVCPACGGGSTGESSLRLTRLEPGLCLYKCHRASCGASGSIRGAYCFASAGSSIRETVLDSGQVYSNDTHRLGKEWLSELRQRYRISEHEAARHGWAEEAGTGRLVVYIRGPQGDVRGVHTRAGPWQTGPKSRDYRTVAGNWAAWFRAAGAQSNALVLVEDVLSAAKVAQSGFDCVSLMGTSLSLDKLREILREASGNIALALDRDATNIACDICSRYSFLTGGRLRPLIIRKDLKYHTEEEIQSMVQECCSS